MMRRLPNLVFATALVLPVLAARANNGEAPRARSGALKVGDVAPDFAIPDAQGAGMGLTRLSDLRGKSVVIAFFPKAFSQGCTRQLSEYRDDFHRFRATNTELIAVSGDSPEETRRFREEYGLPFTVIGDETHAIINAYHVPMTLYLGRLYAHRSVFLVDENGIIRYLEMEYSVLRGKEPLYRAMDALDRERAAGREPPASSE